MQRKALTAILGVITGCALEQSIPGSSDDVERPATPSTPVPASPEQPTPQAPTATPVARLALDKTSLATELLASEPLTATITSAGGFAGAVALTAAVIDDAGSPVPGATATLNAASLTVAANGTASTTITIKLPNNAPATAKVKITGTSTAGQIEQTVALTIAKQITLAVKDNGNGQCVYPAGTIEIRVGTKVRFVAQAPTINALIVHSNGAAGVAHQGNNGLAMGQAYEQTTTNVGTVEWYCHAPGPNNGAMNPRIRVVAQ